MFGVESWDGEGWWEYVSGVSYEEASCHQNYLEFNGIVARIVQMNPEQDYRSIP